MCDYPKNKLQRITFLFFLIAIILLLTNIFKRFLKTYFNLNAIISIPR